MLIDYEWRGPEEALDTPFTTAFHMSVRKIEDKMGTLSASGIFKFRDHIEGGESTNHWIASGTSSDEKLQWKVRCKDPDPGEFTYTGKNGEPLFCSGEDTNSSIEAFIAGKLNRVIQYMRDNPGKQVELIDEPSRYEGKKHEYNGDCICHELALSSKDNPFDWTGHTRGGNFPKNCFKCSCGNEWFQNDPEKAQWIRVGDPEAWYLLTKYDGVITEYAGLHPRLSTPTLVLTRNLRSQGFIPFG